MSGAGPCGDGGPFDLVGAALMCKHGDTIDMEVPIIAALSHTGEAHVAVKPIDRCIAPIVRALNAGDLVTTCSCCGHGKIPGMILLADGRRLTIDRRCVMRTCDAAVAVLRETDNPAVMWGDEGLLHLIADRAGLRTCGRAWKTTSRVLANLSRCHVGLVAGHTSCGRYGCVRIFWLPEHAPAWALDQSV